MASSKADLALVRPDPIATREPTTPEDPAAVLKPWERMPRETDGAWVFFLAFRGSAYPDGPTGRFIPRNLNHLAQSLGVTGDYLRQLSSSFQWFARASAYDRELDRAKTEADLGEVQLARVRHLRLTAKVRSALEGELDKWLERVQDPEIPTLPPKEIMAGLEMVIKTERLLTGESTANLNIQDGAWDLENLSVEELEVLAALRAKARGGG